MSLSVNTIGYRVMSNYIDALWSNQPSKLSELFSENIRLVHKTNGEIDHTTTGKEAVMKLFQDNFFERIQNIDAKHIKFTNSGMEPEYNLTIEEIMKDQDENKKFWYKDHSKFHLIKEGDQYLITALFMDITKLDIN